MEDGLDYSKLKFWLDLLQWLFTLGLMVFVWIDRGREKNKGAIEALTNRTESLERRLLTAEENLRHSPTHEDIAKLQSQYAGLESKLDRVTTTLDRIHDYLMNAK